MLLVCIKYGVYVFLSGYSATQIFSQTFINPFNLTMKSVRGCLNSFDVVEGKAQLLLECYQKGVGDHLVVLLNHTVPVDPSLIVKVKRK